MDNTRRLVRASNDKMLGGVAGGVARYLDLDAGVTRILTALLVIFTGFGAVLYLIMWAVLPDDYGTTGVDQLRGRTRYPGSYSPPPAPPPGTPS